MHKMFVLLKQCSHIKDVWTHCLAKGKQLWTLKMPRTTTQLSENCSD